MNKIYKWFNPWLITQKLRIFSVFLNCGNKFWNVFLFKPKRISMAFPVPISRNNNIIIYGPYITDFQLNRIVSVFQVWIEIGMHL